jgi:drug/metabolite transporter (DMT)-like permease
MLLSVGLIAILIVCVRVAADFMSSWQAIFLRNLFGWLPAIVWVHYQGWHTLRTKHWKAHIARGVSGVIAMFCWYAGLMMMPLAEAVSLSFTSPIFATIGAALVLKETVHYRRWLACAVGFFGVAIIVQPSADQLITDGAILVIFSAAIMALATLLIKRLSSTESTSTLLFSMGAIMTPLSLIPAIFFWQPLTLEGWLFGVFMGVIGTLAHIALYYAFRQGEASALMPLDYLKMPIVAAFGYWLYAEVPTMGTLIGSGVIVAASLYIMHRERLHRQQHAPAPPPA